MILSSNFRHQLLFLGFRDATKIKKGARESASSEKSVSPKKPHPPSARSNPTSSVLSSPRPPDRRALSEFPSISNRLAFEEFLARTIIPPPPSLSLEESRVVLDKASHRQQIGNSEHQEGLKYSSPEKRVRFSTTAIVRQRSASGGLERLLAKQRLKERISADKIVSVNKAGKVGRLVESQTYPINTGKFSPEKTFESTEKRIPKVPEPPEPELTDFVYAGSIKKGQRPFRSNMSEERLNIPKEKEVRRTTLHDFSGLENTEFRAPEITKVDLKNFVGLEGLNKGVASLEVREDEKDYLEFPPPSKQTEQPSRAGKMRKFFARIRSVDAHTDSSPESSQVKKPVEESPKRSSLPVAESPKRSSLSSPPLLKSIKETSSKSFTASSPENDVSNENATDVEVRSVSLAHYSGLECSPRPSVDHGHSQMDSLIVSSSSRRRKLSKSSCGSEDHSASEELTPTMGFGNGFVNVETCDGWHPQDSNRPVTEKDFEVAKLGIEKAIGSLVASVESIPAQSPKHRTNQGNKQQLKISLLAESQQLAAASKLLVRCATEPHCQVLPPLQRSVAKAGGISTAAQNLIKDGDCTLFQAQSLGAKVREVLKALGMTVVAVKDASGKNLADPEMKKLMLQSTSLAATLTQLIQCVREHMS